MPHSAAATTPGPGRLLVRHRHRLGHRAGGGRLTPSAANCASERTASSATSVGAGDGRLHPPRLRCRLASSAWTSEGAYGPSLSGSRRDRRPRQTACRRPAVAPPDHDPGATPTEVVVAEGVGHLLEVTPDASALPVPDERDPERRGSLMSRSPGDHHTGAVRPPSRTSPTVPACRPSPSRERHHGTLVLMCRAPIQLAATEVGAGASTEGGRAGLLGGTAFAALHDGDLDGQVEHTRERRRRSAATRRRVSPLLPRLLRPIRVRHRISCPEDISVMDPILRAFRAPI
jgi:hypothetical protein